MSTPEERVEYFKDGTVRARGHMLDGLMSGYWEWFRKAARVEIPKSPLNRTGESTMKITTVGIDLAKNLFQVHGENEYGKAALRSR